MMMKCLAVSALFAAAAVSAASQPHDAMGNPLIIEDGATVGTSLPAAATATLPDSSETSKPTESSSQSSAASSAVSSSASSSGRATASGSASRPSSSTGGDADEEDGDGNGAAGAHFSFATLGAIAGFVAYSQL
ncbi:hypothetical protein IWQ62_002546 [Dispira parvispora]|uniref:Uncharacterized protein n=1 Tax=Dispira parvispora TaxID=1520584 RepID=A0A9W8AVH4_9FUNG|nr:hypothetical protein IWQ62_002546 [Dispira parvispora]